MDMYTLPSPELENIAAMIGVRTEAGLIALKYALKNIQTLDKKQQDYGAGNIADFGELGVLVRANDKIARLKNLINSNKNANFESVSDTWLDLANYSLIGAMVHHGDWPEQLKMLS